MRRTLTLALAILGLASPGFAQNAQLHLQRDRGKALAGSYIVVLNEGASAGAVAERHGASPTHVYSTVLNGFAAELSRGQLQQVLRDPDVKYVDEDGVVQAVQATPGSVGSSLDASADVDPAVVQPGATWGLDKLDQQWGAGLDGGYDYTNRGLGVNAYIVDTGIRYTHQDFDGAALNRAKKGFDAVTPGGSAADCNGHGTHVAGTVGGTTYGVAKAVKLYAVRVLDCGGSGSWAGFIAGAEWVTANHIKPAVANASLAGGYTQAANDAVTKSISWGVVWVLAAANANDNACNWSPASTPNAITVGATDINNNKAGFSNWGPCVDINGPGVNITSDWWTADNATNTISGTSMASPHVAGLVALYLEAVKTSHYGQTTTAILNSGVRGIIGGLFGGTPNLLAHKIVGRHTGVNQAPGANCSNQEPDVFNGQCYYFNATAGYIHIWLRGQPGTNLNIGLYQWNGSAWVLKASKATGSTNEYLKYSAAGGFYYMYLITNSLATAGTYDSWIIHDGMQP